MFKTAVLDFKENKKFNLIASIFLLEPFLTRVPLALLATTIKAVTKLDMSYIILFLAYPIGFTILNYFKLSKLENDTGKYVYLTIKFLYFLFLSSIILLLVYYKYNIPCIACEDVIG